ncbi:DUF5694 domain-containing protein [Lysinibacillus fusiformis]
MNEIFQVGFRLGLKMWHEQIYPIDWMGESDIKHTIEVVVNKCFFV